LGETWPIWGFACVATAIYTSLSLLYPTAVYLGKALEWALKYSLDVMVDLHGVPGPFGCSMEEEESVEINAHRPSLFLALLGSQNAFDNSGQSRTTGPGWASSKTNVDRSLEALGVLTTFVTAAKYRGVVKAIEVLNEPIMDETGAWGATWNELSSYYVKGEWREQLKEA
jgi:glucan 1,3-beta-glucosidase